MAGLSFHTNAAMRDAVRVRGRQPMKPLLLIPTLCIASSGFARQTGEIVLHVVVYRAGVYADHINIVNTLPRLRISRGRSFSKIVLQVLI